MCKKGCLITVFGLVVLVFLLIGGIKFPTSYAKTEIAAFSSGDGIYTLIVYMIGEPEWPFGETHCSFDLLEGRKRVSRYPFSIKNDGAIAHRENFHVTWNADNVTILVSSKEQGTTEYILSYDGT
ncbi:MAG: hypothetical protein ACI39W_08115 [Brotaphodocola sp.]